MMAKDDEACRCEALNGRSFDCDEAAKREAISLLTLVASDFSAQSGDRRARGSSRRFLRGRRPILLFENMRIVGVSSVPDIDGTLAKLREGRRLRFVRDACKAKGRWTVEVYAGERLLGYVPFECSETVARLIDGGRKVVGVLELAGQPAAWDGLRMRVFLVD